jgi:hypothetical protein
MTNNSLQNLNISYYNCIDQISKCFHFQNFLLTNVKPDSVAHLNFFASCSKRDNSNKKIWNCWKLDYFKLIHQKVILVVQSTSKTQNYSEQQKQDQLIHIPTMSQSYLQIGLWE